MPIRFRCHHCNQLMGIARRKAGMTVQCPTCRAKVVVPQPAPEAPPAAPAVDAAAPLFERSDFEDFLQNPVAGSPAAPAPPPAPSPFESAIPSLPAFAPPSAAPRTRSAGLVLSPTQATWLTVAVILLLALAFGAGLLVGHYWIG